jgi:hypothetical protein
LDIKIADAKSKMDSTIAKIESFGDDLRQFLLATLATIYPLGIDDAASFKEHVLYKKMLVDAQEELAKATLIKYNQDLRDQAKKASATAALDAKILEAARVPTMADLQALQAKVNTHKKQVAFETQKTKKPLNSKPVAKKPSRANPSNANNKKSRGGSSSMRDTRPAKR